MVLFSIKVIKVFFHVNITIFYKMKLVEIFQDKDKKKYSFQTMTRKRFNDLCVKHGKDEAIKQLSDRILHNVIVDHGES